MEKVFFENAQIGFRNFEGREGLYNKVGERSFVIWLDDARAQELVSLGFNVKFPDPNNSPELTDPENAFERPPYLQVKVNVNNFGPKAYLIASDVKTRLDEQTLALIDVSSIDFSDIVINPYEWNVQGKSGVAAYLDAIYVNIQSDAFSSKYGV
jgi:hypothetical protein